MVSQPRIKEDVMKRLKNERGQSILEYVLIAAAVVGLAVLLIQKVRQPVNDRISNIATDMQTPVTGN